MYFYGTDRNGNIISEDSFYVMDISDVLGITNNSSNIIVYIIIFIVLIITSLVFIFLRKKKKV